MYMPFVIVKVRGKECYKVINKITGRVHSQCATRENADKQVKLLHMLEK